MTLLDTDGNTVDQVASYAGIRTVGKSKDKDGHWRFTLNGKEIFHWGPLDQGWWPDGLLTPPSDEGMLFDIEFLKAAGFNMIRKHIKVEPRRYYYHCDRLGMMVWQDHVSGGEGPPWTRLKPDPVDAEWPENHHRQFLLELERMISTLENHPSIVSWVPFNERWGQHRTIGVGMTKSVIGHEGATMRKIGDKYVHFGTAWSTDQGRKGSYNLYYCTADKITGPYGPRKFAGRFLGHGTPFQDRNGKWWCTAFFNANVPPLHREGIEKRDLGENAQTINEQGVTIVPLDVRVLDDGDIHIRAKDPAYATPGPDEVQKFED